MIIFGLVLLILAIIVIAYVWLATGGMSPISVDYGILNVELSPLWFFFAGGITLAVATSGLWLMGVGAKSSARKAKEVRELRRQAKESDRSAERGRDRAGLGKGSDRGTATSAPERRAGDAADTPARPGGTTSTGSATSTGATGGHRNEPGTGSQDHILPRPGQENTRGDGPGRLDLDR